MTEDQPLPSPRTTAEPMAFTRDELLGGALRTWALFVVLFVGCLLVALVGASWGSGASAIGFVVIVVGYAALICAVIAAFATVVLIPAIWLLGRALRRERHLAVHLSVYTILGAAVAAAAAASAHLIGRGHPGLTMAVAAAALVAVPLGWWLTARTALRRDRGVLPRHPRRERVDVDMLAEDSALG